MKVSGDTRSEPSATVAGAGKGTRVVLLGLVLLSLGIHMVGLRRDLPYPDVDEPVFVTPAVHIAATGDLNPHWFGHPGSTVIYPLAAAYHVWDAVGHGGPLLSSDRSISRRFAESPAPFYVLGRLWSIAFAVASVPLLFLIGRRAFQRTATRTAPLAAPSAIGQDSVVGIALPRYQRRLPRCESPSCPTCPLVSYATLCCMAFQSRKKYGVEHMKATAVTPTPLSTASATCRRGSRRLPAIAAAISTGSSAIMK